MKRPGGRSGARNVILVGVLSLAFSAASTAQDRRLEVTGFFGGLSIDHDLGSVDNIFFTTTGQADDVEFFKYYGLRVDFNITPYIGIEGNLSRSKNTYSFTVVDDIELDTVPLGDQFDASQVNYGGNLIVQFPLEIGVVPYGTVGAGWQKTTPDQPISGIDTVSGIDFNFGGGVKYFLEGPGLPWLGVRFDIRYHMISEGLAFIGNEASPRGTEITIGAVVSPF